MMAETPGMLVTGDRQFRACSTLVVSSGLGRLQALASVHRLFVDSRWTGADLPTIASEELSPYVKSDGNRVQIRQPRLAQAFVELLAGIEDECCCESGSEARSSLRRRAKAGRRRRGGADSRALGGLRNQ